MKTIYLDNNATTAVAPEVREAMLPYLTDLYGNPSSMHTFGGQVGRAVEEARERMAALLGAHPDEIIFTSCGSESDNAAIWSALQTQPEKRHLITTRVEHPAILNVAQYWERQGYRVTLLGVDNKGRLDLDEYAAALSDDTALVSIMYANNEVGNVFPISRMAEMIQQRFNISVSRSTITRVRNELGFHYRPPRVKQELTEIQKKERVEFCHWALSNRDKIPCLVFSDESRFQLGPDNCWRRIRRGEHNESSFVSRVKFNTGVMIWGAIA